MTHPVDLTPAGVIRADPPGVCLRWAEATIGNGARVVSVRSFGGYSAAVHRLKLRTRQGWVAAVMKRFVRRGWLEHEPEMPGQEARALELMADSGIPLPALLGSDLVPDTCDVPTILMSLAPGRPRVSGPALGRSLEGLAAMVVRIHALPATGSGLPAYEPWYLDEPDSPPAWAREPDAWHEAFAIARGSRPRTTDRLIHRDYNPWNVLWRRGEVSAVIDWANACIGPAEVDVAHLRHNLWAIGGSALADGFFAAWQQASGVADWDPYWDVQSAVEWLPDTPASLSAAESRRHETFLLQALRRLG